MVRNFPQRALTGRTVEGRRGALSAMGWIGGGGWRSALAGGLRSRTAGSLRAELISPASIPDSEKAPGSTPIDLDRKSWRDGLHDSLDPKATAKAKPARKLG
jgi:hypothetical protein